LERKKKEEEVKNPERIGIDFLSPRLEEREGD
jgi:hypothetical protein